MFLAGQLGAFLNESLRLLISQSRIFQPHSLQPRCLTSVLALYNISSPRMSPHPPPAMAEEKEKIKFEETVPDHTATGESGDVIDEKKLLRKLDWHLVPGLTLLLLISFLDRGNGDPFPLDKI
jgi:hypothetical protein